MEIWGGILYKGLEYDCEEIIHLVDRVDLETLRFDMTGREGWVYGGDAGDEGDILLIDNAGTHHSFYGRMGLEKFVKFMRERPAELSAFKYSIVPSCR